LKRFCLTANGGTLDSSQDFTVAFPLLQCVPPGKVWASCQMLLWAPTVATRPIIDEGNLFCGMNPHVFLTVLILVLSLAAYAHGLAATRMQGNDAISRFC
jgi:hypothetical protein